MSTPIAELLAAIDVRGELAVRAWERADAPALVEAWADADIARWNAVPSEPTLALAERWIGGTAAQHADSPSVDVVVVRDGEVAGEVGFQIDRNRRLAEVGFWVGVDHRGHGVGRALLDVAGQLAPAIGVEHLVAVTDAANERAIGLLQRCEWAEVRTTADDRRAFARRGGGD